MITLFIDTSSSDVSIAVFSSGKILSSITKEIPNQHSIYTVSFVEQVLKEAKVLPNDIEKIMVVTGPGSFTGLRIGVTIAKVYAYLENIEIIAVSSLKTRALSIQHDYCLSVIDAHHEHYYFGLYDRKNRDVIPEQFGSRERVRELIEKYQPIIVSDADGEIDGYSYMKQHLDITNIISYYQVMPSCNPHLVNPNYLKLPQALEERHD